MPLEHSHFRLRFLNGVLIVLIFRTFRKLTYAQESEILIENGRILIENGRILIVLYF